MGGISFDVTQVKYLEIIFNGSGILIIGIVVTAEM